MVLQKNSLKEVSRERRLPGSNAKSLLQFFRQLPRSFFQFMNVRLTSSFAGVGNMADLLVK